MDADWLRAEAGRQAVVESQALNRIGEPRDIAAVAGFFASPAAGWVTLSPPDYGF